MRLFDTARGAVVDFSPGPVVTLYTCGITPYDATHVGHAATYVLYDVLQRRLRDLGHEPRCVRNVTDVDDDILRRARELGVHYQDLAREETARFSADMQALNVLPVFREPAATSAIADIRDFVARVLQRGHAYRAAGAVYFSVESFAGFGSVSHLGREEMLALAAERGGNPDDPAKRDPLDFVLWQPSKEDEPSWPSPWGPGRPGWHVECSTLALRELGTTIDLHGGGTDLIFPHHECEAAQSEAATGEPFVRHWLHAPMVRWEGEKMSKSRGNLVFVSHLVKEHEPMAVRLALLDHGRPSRSGHAGRPLRSGHAGRPLRSGHAGRREDWEWHDGLLVTAAGRLAAWRATGPGDGALDEVRAALDDDLDLPTALAAVDRASAAGRGVDEAADLLGVAL